MRTFQLRFKGPQRPYHVTLTFSPIQGMGMPLDKVETRDFEVKAPSKETAAIVAYHELRSDRVVGFSLLKVQVWVKHPE